MRKKWIIAAIFTAAAVYTAIAAGPSSTMSIKRVDDPVEIQGKDLKDFIGQPIAKMRLHVYKNGAFEPAPYQIDERDKNNEWVFTVGEEKAKDDDDGKIDANDELAFMAFDLGDEAPDGAKPDGAKACYKIAVTDPVDNGAGYAYICEYDNPPAPSKKDYVSYEEGADWMYEIGQTYKTGTGTNESFFERAYLRKPGGPWGPDILDRYKTRGVGIPIPGKEELPESSAKAKVVGWIDGPVRVIRKTRGWLQVAWKIKIHGSGSSQNIYYPTWFVVPLLLEVPSLPKPLLKNFKLIITLDFLKYMYGSKYYDDVNQQGETVDGQMSDAEKNLDRTKNHNWFVVTGPKGTVMARYVLPPEMKKWAKTPVYYVDDMKDLDPPEEEPGQSNFGFSIDLSELPAGQYKYSAYFHFPQNFKWENRNSILNILDKPLKATLTKL